MTFDSILENINVDVITKKVNKFVASSAMEMKMKIKSIQKNNKIKLDMIENGDNFLLYSITDKYETCTRFK